MLHAEARSLTSAPFRCELATAFSPGVPVVTAGTPSLFALAQRAVDPRGLRIVDGDRVEHQHAGRGRIVRVRLQECGDRVAAAAVTRVDVAVPEDLKPQRQPVQAPRIPRVIEVADDPWLVR